MQPGTHVAVSIGIVELVGLVTGHRPQGAETLLPLVCGVLIDGDHVIDRFVGKQEEVTFNFEATDLTVAEASEKAKWHLPHYIIVGWPLILLFAWLANRIGAVQGWEWLALSNFWVFWGGVVPFLVHTLLDVSLITHGGDWELFPLNFILRWLGIRLPLGIVPNGSQTELWIGFFLNIWIIILIPLLTYWLFYIEEGDFMPIVIIPGLFMILLGYLAADMLKWKISAKFAMGVAVLTMVVFIIVRWPVF